MELSESGRFFLLMGLHAYQDIRQEAQRRLDVGSFVQHHALGTACHGGIGDFCP
jgi:hypothetical protein